MSSINSVTNGNYPLNPINGSSKSNGSTRPPEATSRSSDKVELSGVQNYLSLLNAGSDVRTDKVASVRASIEAGNYEDDFKLNIALDRLLDDVNA